MDPKARHHCESIVIYTNRKKYRKAAEEALENDIELLTIAEYSCERNRLTNEQFDKLAKVYHNIPLKPTPSV